MDSQEGSAAVFLGTDNYITSAYKLTLLSCTATKNAGCFKMQGTGINSVLLDGTTLKYSPVIG